MSPTSTPIVPFSVLYGMLPSLIKRAKELGLPPSCVVPPEGHHYYAPQSIALLKERYQEITGEAWTQVTPEQLASSLGSKPELNPSIQRALEQFMDARSASPMSSVESAFGIKAGAIGEQLDAELKKKIDEKDDGPRLVVLPSGRPPIFLVLVAMPEMLKTATKWGFPDALVVPPMGAYPETDRYQAKARYTELTGKVWRQPTAAEITNKLQELKAHPDADPLAVNMLQEVLDNYVNESEETGSEETVTVSSGQNQDERVREIRKAVKTVLAGGQMPPVADVLRFMPELIRGAQKNGIPEELILPWKDNVYTPEEYDVLRAEFKKLTGRVWTLPAKHDLVSAIGDLKLNPSPNPLAILAVTEVLNELYPEEPETTPAVEELPVKPCGCADCAPPNDQLSKEMVNTLELGMEEVNTLLLSLFEQVGDNIVGVTLPEKGNRVTKPFTPGTPERDFVTLEADRDDFNKLTLVFQSVPRYGQIRVAYDGADLQWTVGKETGDGVPVLVGVAVDYLIKLISNANFAKKFHGLVGLLLINEKK